VNQATSVNQTATGSGNIQISTTDGSSITIHSQPQHEGLTVDQLWQRTRDEMQRNAEEKVRIKNETEDSFNRLRSQNNLYQKQIETLQDELDELTAKLHDTGYNVESSSISTGNNKVDGVDILKQILTPVLPNFNREFSIGIPGWEGIVEELRKELFLSLFDNRHLTSVEKHAGGIIVVRHNSGRWFTYYCARDIGDPRQQEIEIVEWLNRKLSNYMTTHDRFCKVRTQTLHSVGRDRSQLSPFYWFIFGTEIIEDKNN